jgi:hypothetical protein
MSNQYFYILNIELVKLSIDNHVDPNRWHIYAVNFRRRETYFGLAERYDVQMIRRIPV